MIGERLGPYTVVAKLGEGGMGEVYRARDSKLNRDVALKVLLPDVATDPDRLARFSREAQVLASLNHPNIAQIHGLEESGARGALVMELVEGPTLADRIARGPMPLDDVLPIATQIAEALEAAHERGIIHRDLKPANVKVRPDGTVKVLDFGLAKAIESAPASDASAAQSPTLSLRATQAGIVLGTAAYMSPEQVRGKPVDRRADIWAWGSVLFEMLAGRRAFGGDDTSTTLAAVLKDDVNWSALPADTPPHIRTLIGRCLKKDPRERLRDAGDARLLLLDRPSIPDGAPARRRTRVLWLGALAAVVAAAVVASSMLRPAPPAAEPAAMSALLPEGVTMTRDTINTAVSPDGRRLAVAAADASGVSKILIRDLARAELRVLPGTEGAGQPFWSPDGARLGFFAGGKLKTIIVSSGSINELCDAPLPRGGAWGAGVIVLQPRSIGPLMRIPDQGGQLSPTTVITSGSRAHRFPSFLPDGRHFVYSVTPGVDFVNVIELGSVDGVAGRKVEDAINGAVYAAPGYLVFFRDGAMRARRFDSTSLQPSGPALALPGLDFISMNADGAPMVSVSANGVIVQPAIGEQPQILVWVDRHGIVGDKLPMPEGHYYKGAIAPDGRRVAVEFSARSSEPSMIWILDLVRGTSQRMTFEAGNHAPVWSPDGGEIAFTRQIGSRNRDLWTMRSDTPGSAQRKIALPNIFNAPVDYAPDGKSLVYRTQGTDTRQDVMLAILGETVTTRPLLATQFNELYGVISPDGRSIAYLSDESGTIELYVRAFPAMTGQVRVSTSGAFGTSDVAGVGRPAWRRDGRELIYLAADGRTVHSVEVHPGTPPDFGTPRSLFALPAGTGELMVATPALDRFLMGLERRQSGRVALTVLSNWTALLEQAK